MPLPAAFGDVFEHSPWVAERAVSHGPFADTAVLHAAMMAQVHAATPAEQLALIRAHPELAARIALTDASAGEQQGAGLQALSEAEYEKFSELNQAYREKFGFPFVICVRQHGKAAIIAAFASRLTNDAATERAEALAQIGEIARLRLEDLAR